MTVIATVAALLAASGGRLAAYGQLKLLRGEAEARAEDARTAQARLIYWSVEVDENASFAELQPLVHLHNLSTEPAVSINLLVASPGAAIKHLRGSLFPTGAEGRPSDYTTRYLTSVHEQYGHKQFVTSAGEKGMWGAWPHQSG